MNIYIYIYMYMLFYIYIGIIWKTKTLLTTSTSFSLSEISKHRTTENIKHLKIVCCYLYKFHNWYFVISVYFLILIVLYVSYIIQTPRTRWPCCPNMWKLLLEHPEHVVRMPRTFCSKTQVFYCATRAKTVRHARHRFAPSNYLTVPILLHMTAQPSGVLVASHSDYSI